MTQVAEPVGPVVQQAPGELPKPATAPIIPPMTVPQTPSWKQDQQQGGSGEPPAQASEPAGEAEKKESNE